MAEALRDARSVLLGSSGRLLARGGTRRVGPPGPLGAPRHRGTRARMGLRASAPRALLALSLVCCSGPRAAAPPPEPRPPSAERESPPGTPFVDSHATGRPHVIRLAPSGEASAPSWLQVSSPLAGVMAAVDGEPERPLPLRIELVGGVHEIRATCPDGTRDIRRTIVPPGGTVRVTVCPAPEP